MNNQLQLFPHPKYEVSRVELSYKFKGDRSQRPKITTSQDAYNVIKDCWDDDKLDLCEEGKVMYLNRMNKVLSVYEVSKGGVSGTVLDPKLIIAAALLQNATTIILFHNHPSDSLTPSRADEGLTQKINDACRVHDIKLLDHQIIGRSGYYSFADNGLII